MENIKIENFGDGVSQYKNEVGEIMELTYLDIFQIIFIVAVFVVGLVGFFKAATSDDKK